MAGGGQKRPGEDMQGQAQKMQNMGHQQQQYQQQQYAQQQSQQQNQMRQQQEHQRRLQEQQRLQQQQSMQQQRQQQQQMEMQKRKEEMERQRKEQGAALKVRQVIQRMRLATPENVEILKKELEETMLQNMAECGSQMDKVKEEAQAAGQFAEERVKQIEEQKKQEEERKAEEERIRKVTEEATTKLLEEAETKVKELEEVGEKVDDAKKPMTENGDMELGDIRDLLANIKDVAKSTKEACKGASDFINQNRFEMEKAKSMIHKTRQELITLHRRIADVQSKADKACVEVKGQRDKAIHKEAAKKHDAEEKKVFTKFDKNKDKKLDRKEATAYAKEVQKHTLDEKSLDRIFGALDPQKKGGISEDDFAGLKTMVGIVREEAREAKRRAERAEKARLEKEAAEKRAKELAEMREKITQKCTDIGESLDEVQKKADEGTETAKPLLDKDCKLSSQERIDLAEEVEGISSSQKVKTKELRTTLEELKKEEHGNDKETKAHANSEANKMLTRCNKVDGQLNLITKTAKSGLDKAKRDQFNEVEEIRGKVVKAFRETMDKAEKSSKDLFGAITEKDVLSEADFLAYTKKCDDLKELEEDSLKKVFKFMAGKDETLSKEAFAANFRVFYKVVKQTVLTDNISIKESKTIRRLEVGEVMEVFEGPKTEVVKSSEDGEDSSLLRVKGQITKDQLEGWVTVSGNQGTVFLEPGGNTYKVKIAADFTEGLDAKESTCLKQLKPGAIIQVMEMAAKDEASGDMRVKGMIKGDGAIGYFTQTTADGKTCLEAVS
eukprot:gnl/MRDRNA2_/MRDRNA2_92225_c0_seq1.p1 gnl/MRDRNA2_/MRDRNA2_92225_c0~~gnl/MRDRNA2_/MRDRNA2_92225_c0_seq1.p1  ORF type:complete len:905 (-),score=324.00 gnl/MRDRNA2_/MRDRNA2_92225_c0_seq1:12-2357(-)